MGKLRLKKGDTVRVMTGKHRGAEGEVLQVNHATQRVLVKNVNVIEQLVFPEISFDQVDATRGMDITIVTSAKTDEEARSLLELLGMPFRK